MDAKTLQALEDSIKHWEDNVKAETDDKVRLSRYDCALCLIHNAIKTPLNRRCLDCPVALKTNERFCEGTPYINALNAWKFWGPGDDAEEGKRAFQAAAQAMLDFLISLRPEKSND